MKFKTKKIIAVWMVFAVFLPASFAAADETEIEKSIIVAQINGQELTEGDLQTIENQYLALYESSGYDVTDEDVLNEIHKLALDLAIEEILVDQDMEELGFYEYSDEEREQAEETAQLEYEYSCYYLMEDYYTYLPDGSEEDARSYAEDLMDYLGYTLDTLTELCLESNASEAYRASLTADIEVSEEEIEETYKADVERDKSAYEDDIEAFEEALYYSDDQVWYIPEGYRAFRQILLPATGDDEESMIASVQDTIDEIKERKDAGEDAEILIEEYGDASGNSGDFYMENGYWIHPDSVIWAESIVEAAFGEDVRKVGDFADPVAGNSYVYLLIYEGDVESGEVELTEELKPVIEAEVRADTEEEKYQERVGELKEEADIVIYED